MGTDTEHLVGTIKAQCESPGCAITTLEIGVNERAVAEKNFPLPPRGNLICPNCFKPLRVKFINGEQVG